MSASGIAGFGRWIKAAREFHGISLDELAKRSGVSKGHLSKIENDLSASSGISLAVAEKLTLSFGMPLWQVLKRISQ